MTAFGIGAAYPRDALEIVAARREALAQLLDTFKAVPAVGSRVLLIVLGAELAEVPLEYSMELVAAAGNVLIPYRGRDRDCRAHINIYGRNELPASDGGRGHRAPHNTYEAEGEREKNLELMTRIDELHTDNITWGSRLLRDRLRLEGWKVNRKRIQRLMRLMQLQVVYPKPKLTRPK